MHEASQTGIRTELIEAMLGTLITAVSRNRCRGGVFGGTGGIVGGLNRQIRIGDGGGRGRWSLLGRRVGSIIGFFEAE